MQKASVLATATAQPERGVNLQRVVDLVVTGELVNVRAEPSTTGPIMRTAFRGERLVGIERSADLAWWRVGPDTWVYYQLVSQAVDGSTSSLPAAQLPSEPTGQFVAAAPSPIPSPIVAVDLPFRLELIERHREVNNVTLYAFIHEDGRALDGHYLAVTVNGVAAPGVRERSSAEPLGETRPACKGVIFDAVLCAENRIYNLKQSWETRLMFPGFSPWGTWRVQLVDGGGQPLGPWAVFEIQPGQSDLELYVRYVR